MRKKLVIGNWKMHGNLQQNEALLSAILRDIDGLAVGVAVCVPFPYLQQTANLLSGSVVAWGAQTLSEHPSGAYTGEVSASMLRDFGCRYVLVGHSERRALFGETDAAVAAKFRSAQVNGLVPVLCVGETLAERDAGRTLEVVRAQVNAVINLLGVEALASAVVAYEPVWAIGTGVTASPAQAQEVHAAIRDHIAGANCNVAQALPILYGGSVKAQNAAALFACKDIDGGLIGGAALVAEDFVAVCRAAA